jgi:uroporphyrinogen decarboxylase
MPPFLIPLDKPKPDAARFMRYILGADRTGKPPTIEYMVDIPIIRAVVTGLLGRQWVVPTPGSPESLAAHWDNLIEFWHRMGYDTLMMEVSLPFLKHDLPASDTAAQTNGQRLWADEHQGAIASWDDFENYRWPRLEDADFSALEYVNAHLPEGMGLLAAHSGGIFEYVSWIMSLEGLSFALYENPELVKAVAEKVGSLQEGFQKQILDLDRLVALWPGDDMGFRSATLVNPKFLRQHILPWHKRMSELAHQRGVAFFFHSCGNLGAIMEDLIEDVGIDAKHSFEDAIQTAPEFQQRYGDRVATLGGVDMHALASYEPEQLRMYVRALIEACAPRGRFAVGAGNSVANYVPLENYLTMIDEALR